MYVSKTSPCRLVGEELKLPTLIVHAECSLNEQVGRRELSRRLSFQSELLVPYIQKIGLYARNPKKLR